jgi:hypothetical protein
MFLQATMIMLASLGPTADTPETATPAKPATVATLKGKVISITPVGQGKNNPGGAIGSNNTGAPNNTLEGGTLVLEIAENTVVPDGIRYVRVAVPVMEKGKVKEELRTVPVQGSRVKTTHENITLQLGTTIKVKMSPDSGKKYDGELSNVKHGEHVEVRMVKEKSANGTHLVAAEIDVLHAPPPPKEQLK